VYACVCACVFVLGEAHCGGILMCDMCLYLILNALYSLSLLHCTVPTVNVRHVFVLNVLYSLSLLHCTVPFVNVRHIFVLNALYSLSLLHCTVPTVLTALYCTHCPYCTVLYPL